jgi:hypothetical protein
MYWIKFDFIYHKHFHKSYEIICKFGNLKLNIFLWIPTLLHDPTTNTSLQGLLTPFSNLQIFKDSNWCFQTPSYSVQIYYVMYRCQLHIVFFELLNIECKYATHFQMLIAWSLETRELANEFILNTKLQYWHKLL